MNVEISDKLVERFKKQFPDSSIEEFLQERLDENWAMDVQALVQKLSDEGFGRVVLKDRGKQAISVIKTIRSHTGVGLKEAKDASECTISLPQCDNPVEFYNDLKKLGADVVYDISPERIVGIRSKYGQLGVDALRVLMKNEVSD